MHGSRSESALKGRSTKNQKSNSPHRRDYYFPVFMIVPGIRLDCHHNFFRRTLCFD